MITCRFVKGDERMNMFKKIKIERLLNRRYKLKSELMAMEDSNYNFYDSMVYPGGMSAERSIRIGNLKSQIMSINAQIYELEKG